MPSSAGRPRAQSLVVVRCIVFSRTCLGEISGKPAPKHVWSCTVFSSVSVGRFRSNRRPCLCGLVGDCDDSGDSLAPLEVKCWLGTLTGVECYFCFCKVFGPLELNS